MCCQGFGDVNVGCTLQNLFNSSDCPFCTTITLMMVWAGCYMPMSSWSQKRQKSSDLKHGPLSEMIFSASPNFLKVLFSTAVTASVVLSTRVS